MYLKNLLVSAFRLLLINGKTVVFSIFCGDFNIPRYLLVKIVHWITKTTRDLI